MHRSIAFLALLGTTADAYPGTDGWIDGRPTVGRPADDPAPLIRAYRAAHPGRSRADGPSAAAVGYLPPAGPLAAAVGYLPPTVGYLPPVGAYLPPPDAEFGALFPGEPYAAFYPLASGRGAGRPGGGGRSNAKGAGAVLFPRGTPAGAAPHRHR